MVLSKQKKQVVLLYGSSVVGLLLGVLNSVINTRSLPPELYGDVRYVQNIISFVSSLLLVGFFVSGSRLLAISKDELYSRRIRGILCVILGITISILMLVMSALYFCSINNSNHDLHTLYLVSIPLCGNVLMLNYVNTVSQGDNHIGRISIARILPSGLYCIIAFLIYRIFGATPSLMLILYNGIAVVVLLWIILSTRPSFKNLKESFMILKEENKSYGFNVYLGSLVGVSTGYLSGMTLGWFCDTNAQVGFYTLALTLAQPLAMLPSIIGTTYFKRFANQNFIDRKVLVGSIVITALSLVLFVLFVGMVVKFLYNESYSIVSIYASVLAVGTSLHGLGDMFNRFLGAHGQGKMLRNGAFACGIVLLVGSFVLVYYWNIKGALITRMASDMVYCSAMVFYYIRYRKSV